MHSLVAVCMCPDWGSNLQPRLIRMRLQLTELPGQGQVSDFVVIVATKGCQPGKDTSRWSWWVIGTESVGCTQASLCSHPHPLAVQHLGPSSCFLQVWVGLPWGCTLNSSLGLFQKTDHQPCDSAVSGSTRELPRDRKACPHTHKTCM